MPLFIWPLEILKLFNMKAIKLNLEELLVEIYLTKKKFV